MECWFFWVQVHYYCWYIRGSLSKTIILKIPTKMQELTGTCTKYFAGILWSFLSELNLYIQRRHCWFAANICASVDNRELKWKILGHWQVNILENIKTGRSIVHRKIGVPRPSTHLFCTWSISFYVEWINGCWSISKQTIKFKDSVSILHNNFDYA